MKKADGSLCIAHFGDRCGAALPRYRNGAQNTVLMYEMKLYPVWFSCQCKSHPVPLVKKFKESFQPCVHDSMKNPVFARFMHRCSGLVRIKTFQNVNW